MKFEWDEKKNEANICKHGIDFIEAHELFENPMLIQTDQRENYREDRYIGLGYIKGRLMVVVFTKREPAMIRLISLRKANKREQSRFKAILKDGLESHR